MMNWLRVNPLPFCGAATIRMIGRSMSWSVYGAEHVDRLYREGYTMIIAFWHGQQLMMPLAYRGRRARILISRHRDGELIYQIVKRFGFEAIRGSTTRGGEGALRQLIRSGRQGVDLVVTPDGPKGPRHVVQPGVVALARATGQPIVPLVAAYSKKKIFSSWDRFMVPYPFSRGTFTWGTPIWVDRDADADTMEKTRQELEATLSTLSSEAETMVHRPE